MVILFSLYMSTAATHSVFSAQIKNSELRADCLHLRNAILSRFTFRMTVKLNRVHCKFVICTNEDEEVRKFATLCLNFGNN